MLKFTTLYIKGLDEIYVLYKIAKGGKNRNKYFYYKDIKILKKHLEILYVKICTKPLLYWEVIRYE